MSKVAAILLAGGSGSRMQGTVADKTLALLAGKPVFLRSFDAFAASGLVDSFVVVTRDEAQRSAIASLLGKRADAVHWARGGAERRDSVFSGLETVPPGTEIVLIHDAARPLVTPDAIRRSVEAARESGAACLAHRVSDTIKRAAPAADGRTFATSTVDRSNLWAMETPQTFRFALIREAYRHVIVEGRPITDDLSAIETSGHPVVFIDNGRPNLKITHPDDLALAERLLVPNVATNVSDFR